MLPIYIYTKYAKICKHCEKINAFAFVKNRSLIIKLTCLERKEGEFSKAVEVKIPSVKLILLLYIEIMRTRLFLRIMWKNCTAKELDVKCFESGAICFEQ